MKLVGKPLLDQRIAIYEVVVTVNGGYSVTSPSPDCEQVYINSLLSFHMFQVSRITFLKFHIFHTVLDSCKEMSFVVAK